MDTKTILVIDADEEFKTFIQETFSERSAHIVFNTDPNEAIVSLAVEAPDFVILSLDFPDGVGILRNVRDFNPDIPLVVTTTKVTKEDIIAARRANALDFLLKPVDGERLTAKVSAQLWPMDLAAISENGEAPAENGEAAPPVEEAPPEEAFVEAIPKGAEMANINEILPGMKIARVVEHNGVVYIDKGVVLRDEHIRLLNKLGVPDVCVYTDKDLKRRAQELKKQLLSQSRIDPNAIAIGAKPDPKTGGKTAARSSPRIPLHVPCTARLTPDPEEGDPVIIEGELDDLSAGGCAFLSADNIKKDQEFILNFKIDDAFPMKDIKAVARYCKHSEDPEKPHLTGFLFTSLTQKFREQLTVKLYDVQREQKRQEMMKKNPRLYKPMW